MSIYVITNYRKTGCVERFFKILKNIGKINNKKTVSRDYLAIHR